MYIVIILILLAGGLVVLANGLTQRKKLRTTSGILLIILTGLFFWFMGFWGEKLWFDSVGFTDRFWTVWLARLGFAAGGFLLGGILVYFLTLFTPHKRKLVRIIAVLFAAFVTAVWASSNWETFLKWWYRVPTELQDPILGMKISFYFFTLPFLDALYSLLLIVTLISLVTAFVSLYLRFNPTTGIQFEKRVRPGANGSKRFRSLYLSSTAFILTLALGQYLNRFHLMYSEMGAVHGPGWADIHIRLPMYNIVAALTVLFSLFILVTPLRKWLQGLYSKEKHRSQASLYISVAAGIFLIWLLGLSIIPGIFQNLLVEPNEITFEKPYIEHNIKFSREGFDLQKVEEKGFPVSTELNQEIVRNNREIFNNVRLWDWRALNAVYQQFQEIRLYYEFPDLDIDRYNISDKYKQVMVSPRELEKSNIPSKSQTFVNKRFKYTHGFGITLTKVNEFTPSGLPNLLIKDIPPVSKWPELEVKQPRIYYGELTNDHVVVNTSEMEFDYPKGDENAYNRYDGIGGVEISNLWRKFLFGWKFDGTPFFFSTYPNENSRILFHREIKQRVKTIAPFLDFDNDPYIVLSEGKLYWIIDAYVTSNRFPYSEPFEIREQLDFGQGRSSLYYSENLGNFLQGANYVRNSVKVVVDAFYGDVNYYVFDEEDPIISVWQKIFPGMFKSRKQLSQDLNNHIRYPEMMLLAQGLVYAKYHMTDPAVFYNQEDLWIRATEKYHGNIKPVDPYYIMWKRPESEKQEFTLILPFTPKNRQVAIGWLAGFCDGENYGRLLAYKFPKDKRVLGPQQVETKIDQNSHLSQQLTLWDQRGSNVIRGNVLAIPVEKTLFYVEPIYLEAETAAYPELRLVVIMHNDRISYAPTFEKAMKKLIKGAPEEKMLVKEKGEKAPEKKKTGRKEWIKRANKAFEQYLDYTGKKQFNKASRAMEKLQKALQNLSEMEDLQKDSM